MSFSLPQIYKSIIFCLITILSSTHLMAQKPTNDHSRDILPKELEERETIDNMVVGAQSGLPINIRGIRHQVTAGDPESAAREYLKDQKELFGLSSDNIENDLSVSFIRNGLSGDVVRLKQYYRGIPVYKGEITIHINKKNRVTYVANSYKYGIDDLSVESVIGKQQAFETAANHAKITLPTTYLKEDVVVFKTLEGVYFAHRHVMSGQEYDGEWEVLTDATNGEVIKSQNITFNCKEKGHNHIKSDKNKLSDPPVEGRKKQKRFFVSGFGNVFNPDPLTTATATYGDTGFTDNNDNNSPQMTATLENVELLGLTQVGSTFELKGPYAEIVDHESPFKGTFSQNSNTFNYDRFDDNFEAVNVYYHVDASMRYLNLSLNLDIMPSAYPGGVQCDPSGLGGADNSHYTGGSQRLAFGEGGVDDAEDSDVIHHELGHGLHDWVTNGGLSQVNGLSEGSGDYWCASYNRSIDSWTSSDPAYFHTFRWDGHNSFWGGRSVNYRPNAPNPPYPGGLVGQIHTDGQIWATCMMDVWDGLGQVKTDQIFWEGLGMTNSATNQDDAANAVFQAAIDMDFSVAELRLVHDPLEACGYQLPDIVILDCTESGDITLTGNVTTDETHITNGKITSNQEISGNANVIYQASSEVDMDMPLQVTSPSTLTITIEECEETPKK